MEEGKKKKKGRLQRGLKKVLNCFLSCSSSTSKESPEEDDVYELTTKPASTKPPSVFGGAAMILGSENSDCSDEVSLPLKEKNRDILEEEKRHASSNTTIEINYSAEEGDLLNSSENVANELEDRSTDFDEEQRVSPTGSFTYTSANNHTSGLLLTHLDPGFVRNLRSMHVDSVYDALILSSVEMEDSDELSQEEILQLIQCSTEPPNHQQENDYDGQKQPVNVKHMGLPNIWNTCYMNSTIQCFLSIPPIIKDIVFQENTWKNEPGSKMLRAFSDLHFARRNKTQDKQKTDLLEAVKDCIAMRNSIFEGDDQQDAHEFLITLLAQLTDEAEMCQHSTMTFRNPVANLEFRVNHLRTCETCGNQSCSTEEVNCLSLVLIPEKSLTESLQQYFATSQLECRCVKCQGTQASESVEIQTLPRVLVLLVMRFDIFTARKIKGCLAVPEDLKSGQLHSCEQGADLYSKEATQQAQADANYKLSGAVSHYGSSLHAGHYVSNIRDPCGAEWLKCDDETVKSVTWTKASKTMENHGYMFFYLRRKEKKQLHKFRSFKGDVEKSCKTDSTVPASLKPHAVLGGAAMILGSETSDNGDEVYLPPEEKNRDILEEDTSIGSGQRLHRNEESRFLRAMISRTAHEFLITLLAQLTDEAEMCQHSTMTFRNPVANLEFRVNRLRTCEFCGNQSCSTEEVNCLSLVLIPRKSLTESLQQYFATSQLECCFVKCQGTQASESVEIRSLPR
ncbi:hypothetical protein E1301_Tti002844 [Triplophysa tibetana]|uniref:USP domain-containing protein n=1 Tax=Triplophysa tibetana TaxID=1572043 RepID=A0A5A9NNK5_9TELE|nr:hypothetical protein E1301_Tti002844 [Triplophysa tibetana]